jgi:hypothetical protein
MTEDLDGCYEIIVKLSKEGGQVSIFVCQKVCVM